jgi:uncharacterized protein (DUF4415 family)
VQKSERLVRYTDRELRDKLARGEDESNYDYVDSLTEEELEASINFEEEGMPIWETTTFEFPLPKQQLTVRFDGDIIAWFKEQGPRYQTRMNAVLRHYVETQKRRAKASR